MEATLSAEKKLKQTRLPFQVLSPSSDGTQPNKKRKFDTITSDNSESSNKVENIKENVKSKNNLKRCREELIEVISVEDSNSPKKLKDLASDIVNSSLKLSEAEKIQNDTEECDNKGKNTSKPVVKRARVDLFKSKLGKFTKTDKTKSESNTEVLVKDDTEVVKQDGSKDELQEQKEYDILTSEDTDHNLDASVESIKEGKDPLTPVIKTPENEKKKLVKKSVKNKSLTPKQLQRMEDSKRKIKEKLDSKLAQEKKKNEEREERKKLQLEKIEQKKREKEEREEERKKLKEDKERIKNEEKKVKEDEKKKKEELKMEEKRKKEEEEELEKKKKAKAAAAFSSFFKKVENKTKSDEVTPETDMSFMPFTVKPDMRVAPITRVTLDVSRKEKLDKLIVEQADCETYLFQLRSGEITSGSCVNTWPLSEKYEVLICEDIEPCATQTTTETRSKLPRPKLLQFHENRRPPYWGTFRRKSVCVGPRKPLGLDKVFDYEVDSDDEWEEEEPGESLHGSDDDKESEDDYEVDNDFFVPHGYLSDEENQDDEVMSPEAQKAKLKLLGEQFEAEMKTKTAKLIPICIGCVWFNNDAPAGVSVNIVKLLKARRGVLLNNSATPIVTSRTDVDTSGTPTNSTTKTSTSQRQLTVPDTAMTDLIMLLHGNTHSKHIIKNEFCKFWEQKETNNKECSPPVVLLSKAGIVKKIKEISTWGECTEEGPMFGKYCWFVKSEVRHKYGVDVKLPNEWQYMTVVRKNKEENVTEPSDDKRTNVSLITKFTKVLTEDERRSSLTKLHSNSPGGADKVKKNRTPIIKFARPMTEEEKRQQLIKTPTLKTTVTQKSEESAVGTPIPKASGQKLMNSWLNSTTNEQRTSEPVKKRLALLVSVPRGQDIPPTITEENKQTEVIDID